MAAEIAKCLKLVAPSNMGAEQQTVWLHAAVDALEDIRASEVADISAELRRSVTRPAQIVPEISRLIAERRRRSSFASSDTGRCSCGKGTGPFAGRTDIHWIKVDGRSQIEFCNG